jgi:hypothetical protein
VLFLSIMYMSIEPSVQTRIQQLIAQSGRLAVGNAHNQCTDSEQMAACSGWLIAAQNVVHQAISDPHAPYRKKADQIAADKHGWMLHKAVREFAAILEALLVDAAAGLLGSVADRARAETFDDFLDHADHYLKESRKKEAGVIAGVVFEDSLRRVCRKLGVPEKGQKLDTLISELASRGELTPVKAKRARASADVRTKATHAQWDEFESQDVQATIELTRELIASKLQ